MAKRMAADAPRPVNGETFEQRLTRVVNFLNEKGYVAKWERAGSDGYYLHTSNCPYHDISQDHSQVCLMDMTLISDLLGTVPERRSWLAAGEYTCSYTSPHPRPGQPIILIIHIFIDAAQNHAKIVMVGSFVSALQPAFIRVCCYTIRILTFRGNEIYF
jgi:hypothetical protein